MGAGGVAGRGRFEARVEWALVRRGRASPFGPESRVKNWVEVWVPRLESQGVKVVVTG